MVTYFILSSGLLKVGKTTDLEKRLKHYKTHNPSFKVIYTYEADVEKEIHEALKSYKVRNEWFDVPEPLIYSTIRFLEEGKTLKPVPFSRLSDEQKAQALELTPFSRIVITDKGWRVDFTMEYPLRVVYL